MWVVPPLEETMRQRYAYGIAIAAALGFVSTSGMGQSDNYHGKTGASGQGVHHHHEETGASGQGVHHHQGETGASGQGVHHHHGETGASGQGVNHHHGKTSSSGAGQSDDHVHHGKTSTPYRRAGAFNKLGK
jgi:hypothetical protein